MDVAAPTRRAVMLVDSVTGEILVETVMLTPAECKALARYVAPSRIRQALVWCVRESWRLRQVGQED